MAIEILDFRPMDKGALRGFLNVKLTKIGLELYDICLFEKGGGKWINLPRKEYIKKDGTKGWIELIRFTERSVYDQFTAEVLAAFEEYQKAASEPEKLADDNVPF